jgi:D-alanyl-D-alanine carboxypeptidase
MPAPMQTIEILSIYFDKHENRLNLPSRMAQCTPDTKKAVLKIRDELRLKGIDLFLSDMFRSHDMQLQAHIENAKKHVFSPLPGGSMHEAGRAFDLDLSALLKNHVLSLADFWEIAAANGLFPIVANPNPGLKEAWHFDCRGSHGRVRQYYLEGKGGNNMKPYVAMAASAILAIGVQVDHFNNQKAAAIQSALIRLGHEVGPLDGVSGKKTRDAIAAAGIADTDEAAILLKLEERLRQTFPGEFEN